MFSLDFKLGLDPNIRTIRVFVLWVSLWFSVLGFGCLYFCFFSPFIYSKCRQSINQQNSRYYTFFKQTGGIINMHFPFYSVTNDNRNSNRNLYNHAVHLSWDQRNVRPRPSQVSTPSSSNQRFDYLLSITTESSRAPQKTVLRTALLLNHIFSNHKKQHTLPVCNVLLVFPFVRGSP